MDWPVEKLWTIITFLHSSIYNVMYTVEPPNKGHFKNGDFVLYLEAVLWWEVQITIVSTRVIPIGAVASVPYIEAVL